MTHRVPAGVFSPAVSPPLSPDASDLEELAEPSDQIAAVLRARARTGMPAKASTQLPASVRVEESRGATRFSYTLASGTTAPRLAPIVAKTVASTATSFREYILAFLRSLFLPLHYPQSVTPDYLEFQAWDTLQALCSYLRGMLCTHAVLIGLGVGEATASASSATLQFVFRDGVGMAGGLAFAWLGAERFGAELKTWRLFADCINDLGLTLELLTPLLPKEYFLPLLSAACICRSLCGVSGGATRAALMQHFALANNAADLSAKEGSQETAVTLLGMVAGAMVVSYIDGPDRVFYTWVLFILLTLLHVYANWRAVRGLVLRSINTQRAYMLASAYILAVDKRESEDAFKRNTDQPVPRDRKDISVLKPVQVARHESLLWKAPLALAVDLGAPLHEAVRTTERLDQLLELQNPPFTKVRSRAARYAHLVCPTAAAATSPLPIVLYSESTSADGVSDRHQHLELRALFHGLAYHTVLYQTPGVKGDPIEEQRREAALAAAKDLIQGRTSVWAAFARRSSASVGLPSAPKLSKEQQQKVDISTAFVRAHFDAFCESLRKGGWKTDHVLLDAQEWRCDGRALDQRAEDLRAHL